MVGKINQKAQRYVQLSAVLEQGAALVSELEKQPLFQAQGSIERNKSYHQQVHAWLDRVKKTLEPDEFTGFEQPMREPSNPSWLETWNVLIDKGPSRWPQTNIFHELIMGVLHAQLDVLYQLRQPYFPGSPIPEHLANRYSIKFNKLGEFTIDRFFLERDCLATWWLPPRSSPNSKSHTRVLGWLDGLALFQPRSMLETMEAVLYDLANHRGGEPDQELIRSLKSLA